MVNYIFSGLMALPVLFGISMPCAYAADNTRLKLPREIDTIIDIDREGNRHKLKSIEQIVQEVSRHPQLGKDLDAKKLSEALLYYWNYLEERASIRAAACRPMKCPPTTTIFSADNFIVRDLNITDIGAAVTVQLAQKKPASDAYAVVLSHQYYQGRCAWYPLISAIVRHKGDDMISRAYECAKIDDINMASKHYHELVHAYDRHPYICSLVTICGYLTTVGFFAPSMVRRQPLQACGKLFAGGFITDALRHAMGCYHEYDADTQALALSTTPELEAYRKHWLSYVSNEDRLFKQKIQDSSFIPRFISKNPDAIDTFHKYGWWIFGHHLPAIQRAERVDLELLNRKIS
jgi:hypothetical protein